MTCPNCWSNPCQCVKPRKTAKKKAVKPKVVKPKETKPKADKPKAVKPAIKMPDPAMVKEMQEDNSREAEATLIVAAAVADAQRRVGRRKKSASPPPAPAKELPVNPKTLSELLLVDGQRTCVQCTTAFVGKGNICSAACAKARWGNDCFKIAKS